MSKQPIGIFDSGVGGTSIFMEIHNLLPNENIIYLADSKNAPYGEKNENVIIDLCIKNTELLIKLGCKLIVVACNTATTNAIDLLRKNYNIPFVGIEPAIKPAAIKSNTKSIGILATKGTLSSKLFSKTSHEFTKGINTVEQIGHGIVELIENGRSESLEMENLLKKYTKPMIENEIDFLVLGCSHYPYIIKALEKILPETVKIIDSGIAVAKQTKRVLEESNILKLGNEKSDIKFYTNTNTETIEMILKHKFKVEILDF